MPLVVVVLACAVFAQGVSEFMVSGLLERIAADVGVPVGAAGLLTSLFAAGMVAGAPVMAVAAGAVPRRAALTGFLVVFTAAHVVGALTTDFAVLLGTRVVAAVANAGFLAVALAALPALAGPAGLGRATSVVLSGVTLACVAGVPARCWARRSAGRRCSGLSPASPPPPRCCWRWSRPPRWTPGGTRRGARCGGSGGCSATGRWRCSPRWVCWSTGRPSPASPTWASRPAR